MRSLVYPLVCVSGACVLSLEILGTRVLGPYYGVSIYLWSALITVTLAALSVGYAIGGRLADRGARMRGLGWMLGGAGVWVLLIPWLKHPLLGFADGFGLRGAVLTASVVLFVPPLTLLGMVSPYAIRLLASRLEEVGRTAGNLFALSTIASVVSAVATGFWLVPNLGVSRLITGIGGLLLLAAAVAILSDRRSAGGRASAAVLVLLAAVSSFSFARPAPEVEGLVERSESPYGEILVQDRVDGRYLLIDGGVHSVRGFGLGEEQHRYVPVMESMRELFEVPGQALLVGLGGGILASSYAEADWEIQAVEIDEEVCRIAVEHFDLDPMAVPFHVADGRRFLRDDERRWDLLLFDAFGSSSIPFHLVTEEMFALAASRLAENGVLALNVETRSWRDPLVGALGATLGRSFAAVWALPTAEPPNTMGNVVLVATNRPEFGFPEDTLPHPFEVLASGLGEAEHWRAVQQNHAWDNRFDPRELGGAVLTDDRSPVDLWAEEINRVARRGLHAFFADPTLY